MMKKVLSLVLALGTVLSCLGTIGVSATDATAATLIYDMEMSKGTVNNSVAGSSVDFQLTEGGTGTINVNAKFVGGDGIVPYIAMSGSKEKLSFASTDSSLLGGSYTLEAWVQLKQTAASTFPGGLYGRPFMNIMGGTTDLMAETNANVMVGLGSPTNTYNASGESTVRLTWDNSGNSFRYCSYYPSTEFNHDNWYKFTLVREVTPEDDGSKISKRLYFNGSQYMIGRGGQYVEQIYTTDTPYTETEVSFAIGSYDAAFENFNIAEVKLYKGVRTADEIKTDYNNEKSRFTALDESELLVYDMDLADFSADAATIANSVEEGAALNVAKANGGAYGKASFTNAAGEQIPFINMEKNNTVLSYEDASLAGKTLTLEAWVNRRSDIGRQDLLRIFGKDELGDVVNEAKLQSGSHSFADVPYASSWSVPNRDTSSQNWFYSMISNTHIKQDAWIHIAVVRDMSVEDTVTETYYFNGAKIKSWTYEAPAKEAVAGFSVQGGSMPQFNVADVKVYADLVFTDSEIKAHYNAEKATYAQTNELVSAQNSAYKLRDSSGNGVMSSSGSKDYGQTFYFETGINSPTDGVVLVAIYEDGRLEAVKSVQVTAETASPLKVEFTGGITYDANAKYEIKAFTWDGMTKLQPCGQAKSYQFK